VHSPRACIPGGGWHIDSSGLQTLAGNGQRMNRLIIVNGEQRQLVYYWFDQRGRSLTSEFAVKWYLFWDAVTRHRSDGAMVRLITAIGATEPVASADARLESFATEIVERLPAYIPH